MFDFKTSHKKSAFDWLVLSIASKLTNEKAAFLDWSKKKYSFVISKT